jgi:hypothetical protein
MRWESTVYSLAPGVDLGGLVVSYQALVSVDASCNFLASTQANPQAT